ncbi:RNA-directed DNA polymerase [Tanacetum coccineum]
MLRRARAVAVGCWLPVEEEFLAHVTFAVSEDNNFRRKTTLLVSISSKVLGFDSIKELYAIDKDFGNIWMELEIKQHRGEFILLDGYLFKGNRLCIPKTPLKSQLVKEIHAKGLSALGRDKTISSIESRFSWPQLKRDVGAFVKRCVVCQEGKDCDDGSRPEDQHLVVPSSDEEIEADVIGPIMVVEDEPLMMLGSGPNISKKTSLMILMDNIRQMNICTNVWLKQEMVCAQRRTWDPGITWLKILKEHLEDKINDNAYVVDLPNTMSISKTFNVSDIYGFHSEEMNEGKHSRTSCYKERGNDDSRVSGGIYGFQK